MSTLAGNQERTYTLCYWCALPEVALGRFHDMEVADAEPVQLADQVAKAPAGCGVAHRVECAAGREPHTHAGSAPDIAVFGAGTAGVAMLIGLVPSILTAPSGGRAMTCAPRFDIAIPIISAASALML